jgi:hypothetical protein
VPFSTGSITAGSSTYEATLFESSVMVRESSQSCIYWLELWFETSFMAWHVGALIQPHSRDWITLELNVRHVVSYRYV